MTVSNLASGFESQCETPNDSDPKHRAILEHALQRDTESFAGAATRLRARTPPQTTESADLIRQDRDRNHLQAPS